MTGICSRWANTAETVTVTLHWLLSVDSQFTDLLVYILCVMFSVWMTVFHCLGQIFKNPQVLSQVCLWFEIVHPCDWFDKDPHYNKSRKQKIKKMFFSDRVGADRRAPSGKSFQQFTCLLRGMDAPWSVSSADGDSPGAFERIWSRWVSSINSHLIHDGI